MARLKNSVIEEIKELLTNNYTVEQVSKKTGASEKAIKKIAESLAETEEESGSRNGERDQEEDSSSDPNSIEHWKKKAEFWKGKYLESWVDLIEISEGI